MFRRRSKQRSNKRTDNGLNAPKYDTGLALKSVSGALAFTDQQVFRWYRLGLHGWSFRPDSQREALLNAIAKRYAELQGRWMHLRITSEPYAISQWAKAHAMNMKDPLPDTPESLSLDDYLVGEQEQVLGTTMTEKIVYLGIQVQSRTIADRATEAAAPLLRRVFPEAVTAEEKALEDEITHLDQIVGSGGLKGRPVTPDEMAWLLERSCALGLPTAQHYAGEDAAGGLNAPAGHDGEWASEDLAEFTDGAYWHQDPYAPTLVVNGRNARHANETRNVAVMTLGRQAAMNIPEVDEPWAKVADRLGETIEWSARIYVRTPAEVTGELRKQGEKVRNQNKHYADEHGLEPPPSLQRQLGRVNEIDDDLQNDLAGFATRVVSWWRIAISGTSQPEALRTAQKLLEAYEPKTNLEHPEAQYALAREFIPGEPLSNRAYARRGTVQWAATAMPQVSAEIGDRRGILLGETSSSERRPVAWDPWLDQEVTDNSGLTPVVAQVGGGKSFLCGGIVYKTLRSGARWTVLDPSGPLAELCEMPELEPYARSIDLLKAQPGILNPYRVVSDPTPEQIAEMTPDEVRRELDLAASTRRTVVRDLFANLLPVDIAKLPETKIVLLEAAAKVSAEPSSHPGMVLDELEKVTGQYAEHAGHIARFLNGMRDQLRLLIPEEGADPYSEQRDDRLTVLTMSGLILPKEGSDRSEWSEIEQLHVELLTLAAWLTRHSVYAQPKNLRKGVWIDEAFFLSATTAGKALMQRLSRDSRKWNVRTLLSSQVPSDLLRIPGFTSLANTAFVGGLDGAQEQADALSLLGVPTGSGYEDVLAGLGRSRVKREAEEHEETPREFIFADGRGGKERIRIDFGGAHLNHLRSALNTTPHTDEEPSTPATTSMQGELDVTDPEQSDGGVDVAEAAGFAKLINVQGVSL